MAAGSLLLLLDDIAAVLDDVAVMSKVAAKKTAGVLGDDLALNAQQVTGVRAERELPVVWAVAKGSFRNKLILVPAALLISAFVPALITPLMMLGGLFLCFEGVEKIAHSLFHGAEESERREAMVAQLADPAVDPVTVERDKVKGAIRTDFILSAEIIVLTLGIVADSDFATQVVVVSVMAIIMTVGVYGLVAGIVKLDDVGMHLLETRGDGVFSRLRRWVGARLLAFAPWLMKALSVVGTAAMFMVGGGILVHSVHALDAPIQAVAARVAEVAAVGPALAFVTPTVLTVCVGVIAGAVLVAVASAWGAVRARFSGSA
jgi:predicted DNA repair protein MutK